MAVNIADYTDYRKFLADLYDQKRRGGSRLSHRYIIRRLGCTSSSFFRKVLDGTLDLPPARALKLASILGLSRAETRYFEVLVRYTQAADANEKAYCLEQLRTLNPGHAVALEADQFEYFSKWYNVAIRELMDIIPFAEGDGYEAICVALGNKIGKREARRSIALLERLQLIRKDPGGRYTKATPSLSAGENWDSQAVAAFQAQVLDMAPAALQEIHKDLRDISTLTLSIGPETFAEIRSRIRVLRKEILALAENDHTPDRVCQLNFALFPLTRVR